MISARPNWAAECGTTQAMAAPSRTCRCQSSGRVMVRVWVMGPIVPLPGGVAVANPPYKSLQFVGWVRAATPPLSVRQDLVQEILGPRLPGFRVAEELF